MSTIGLHMIVRNAASTILAALESIGPYVDQIVIGLGGRSDDNTEQIVKDFLAKWIGEDQPRRDGQYVSLDWNDSFSDARNAVLSKLTTDYAIWIDSDDELRGGEHLRAWIERYPQGNCFWAAYHYDADEHGNVSCTLWRERLIKNPSDWKWESPVHEYLTLTPSVPLALVQMDDVAVVHQEGRQKSKGTRNLDILYRELERTEPDPAQRTLFYLFRENAARGNWHEALLHANRYVSRAQFDDEAYQMAYGIADTLRVQKRMDEARRAAHKAIEMGAAWPDAYFLLARIAYEEGKFDETVEWTKSGATKSPPRSSVIIDPRAYSYWPYYFLGLAYRALNDPEMAYKNLAIAAAVVPDAQIMALLDEAAQEREGQKVLDAFLTVHEWLGRNDEWLKARRLFPLAPKAIETHPAVVGAMHATMESTAHVDDPQVMVDFYRNNPAWAPMSDEMILSADWATHPRMAFARKSISCAPPAMILDIGSSDGFISLPLALDGHYVDGWDLDPRCVDLANERALKWGLAEAKGSPDSRSGLARYRVGSIEDVEAKYDVALALEILEHLVDPRVFLDRLDQHARKVVITTPYLAWEGGRIDDWAKVEPKGHIRTFDLDDMERLLTGRGRIFDLQREPYGRSAWIFASYRPRQQYAATVTFLAPGTLEEWSPRKLAAEGLGGSETALIRVAEELFYAGGNDYLSQLCTVYGRVDNPGFYNGVRYRPWSKYSPEIASDVLVAWRYPEAADLPTRSKRLILWMHDTDAGDRLTPVRAARFDSIVVLSAWHKSHMLKTYPWLDESKLVIIGNGVDRERFAPLKGTKSKREAHRVAYTSSPDRGLDVLLEHVWPKVLEEVPDAELHVYYGWQNFDALAPSRPDLAAFKQRVANLIIDTKGVVQHGRVAPDVLAAELQKASVWLYPSHNFDETYCISAVEAQLAGCVPVTTNRGALAETVASGVVIEGTIGDAAVGGGTVAEQYAQAVVQLLTGEDKALSKLRNKVRRAAPAQGWAEVAGRWLEVLHGH